MKRTFAPGVEDSNSASTSKSRYYLYVNGMTGLAMGMAISATASSTSAAASMPDGSNAFRLRPRPRQYGSINVSSAFYAATQRRRRLGVSAIVIDGVSRKFSASGFNFTVARQHESAAKIVAGAKAWYRLVDKRICCPGTGKKTLTPSVTHETSGSQRRRMADILGQPFDAVAKAAR